MIGQVGQRLSEGRNLVGMMHFTGSPMILECMASAGMDFVNIDLEHSPIDLGTRRAFDPRRGRRRYYAVRTRARH